jgi:hypothetical protein
MTGSRRLVTARPLDITIGPDKSLYLGFTPNDVYVVSAEYYRKAQRLVEDTNIPLMPEDYHMLIVYEAMIKYGYFNVAQEQVAAAERERKRLKHRLECDQLPHMMMGGSLI